MPLQVDVQLDMAMSKDKIINIRMVLDILFGKKHQVLLVFTHIGGLVRLLVLDIAMLSPCESERDAPTGMEGGKEPLAHLVMEDGTNHLKRLVGVAHAIAMSQEELLAVNLGGLGLLVENNATLLFQIFVCPDVVIAREIVHLNPHICQFGDFAQETGEPLWHHILVFIPEVEHVA